MARAASGHLEQLPSGSFRVEVHAGTDPITVRRLRFRQTVRTEEQARIVLGRLLEQASAGQRPDSGVTVVELLAPTWRSPSSTSRRRIPIRVTSGARCFPRWDPWDCASSGARG